MTPEEAAVAAELELARQRTVHDRQQHDGDVHALDLMSTLL